MMTRAEAIEWMEEAIQDINTHWDSCLEALQKELNEQREVFLLAIDAILHADRKQKLEAENMKLKERIINLRKHTVPTREQVEKVWRGEWNYSHKTKIDGFDVVQCSKCGQEALTLALYVKNGNFCPYCGAPLTDKAVEMTMKRMKVLRDDN